MRELRNALLAAKWTLLGEHIMQNRFLALSLFLMVSCASAMETREDKKEDSEKVSLFTEITRGMDADIDFPAFCENFKKQLDDRTLDPNETFYNTGFPGLDTLAEIHIFNLNSPGGEEYSNPELKHPLAMYELLLQSPSFDSEASHSYEIEGGIPAHHFYHCAEKEKECNSHSGFIQEIGKAGRHYPVFKVNNVTHEQVLEILSCAIPKGDHAEHFTTERKERYLNKLAVLKKKFDDIKEAKEMAREKKKTAKWILLCLKDEQYSSSALVQPITNFLKEQITSGQN